MRSWLGGKSKDGGDADPYKYDDLPEELRNQVIHICNGVVDSFAAVWVRRSRDVVYSGVEQALCHEFGLLRLTNLRGTAEEQVWNFFLAERDINRCLDLIRITLACFERFVRADLHVNFDGMHQIAAAIQELNKRFQQHRVGYEFRDGGFVRIDSAFMHREAVAPAMALLNEAHFRGADQEFSKAHEHFRHRRFGECINESLKSFESTMKALCHKRGWGYSQNDTAKKLLATCAQNGLFPAFMQSSLSGLLLVMENVGTVRNKLSAHGQGVQPVQITEEVAAFVVHATAANILLLVSLEKRLP